MLRSVAIRVQSPGEPQAQVEASMQNTMPIPLLRHVVAMTNLAFPVGFHSVSMASARQAAASAGRPPGPAAGASGVVAQQCAQGAAAPEIGRASCREGVCQYVLRAVGGVECQKKNKR